MYHRSTAAYKENSSESLLIFFHRLTLFFCCCLSFFHGFIICLLCLNLSLLFNFVDNLHYFGLVD